jgi:predicted regulator of Ras-like GTPase activity (Roadblock/LC7/MglB family)
MVPDAQAAIEVEETLKRLQSHKGVEAILVVNHDGVPLRSTMTVEQTKKYAEFMSSVRMACRTPQTVVAAANTLLVAAL